MTPTMATARISRGSVPTQNFAHKRSRMDIGLDCSSHIVRPSRLTPGKMNRAAIDASTNLASTRFRKGTALSRKNVSPSPRRGRNLMLNTYTITSTASRISCDHCVVSRKNRRTSFNTSSRLRMPSGRSAAMLARCSVPLRAQRSALSCALLNPLRYHHRCNRAPRTTAAAAVLQSI